MVVGGAALALRGWVPRTTHDVDVIATANATGQLEPPRFPGVLVDAIARVARDFNVAEHWLNNVVGAQWVTGLPNDLTTDLEWRTFRSLRVGVAGRETLLALKLFAAADKGPDSVHVQDLLQLSPTDEELARARAWVLTQDIAVEWPGIVNQVVEHVRAAR